MPGARSPGKIWKFKNSEIAGNLSCKQIYLHKKFLKWLEMHPATYLKNVTETQELKYILRLPSRVVGMALLLSTSSASSLAVNNNHLAATLVVAEFA